jgi:hypothetical protein
MSSTTTTPDRIIRIGVRIDDQVVEERVVGLRKDVALGKPTSKDDDTLDIQVKGIEGNFPLIVWRQGRYYVRVCAPMKGKVTSEGAEVQIESVLKAQDRPMDGDAYLLPIGDDDKGLINLGVTNLGKTRILFRFVEAPAPVAATPVPSANVPGAPVGTPRASAWDDDDRVFAQFLATFSVLAIMFAVYVQNAPRVEPDAEAARKWMQTMKARVVEATPPPVEEAAPTPDAPSEDADKPKEDAPKEDAAKPAEAAKAAPAAAAAAGDRVAAAQRLMSNFSIFGIGTQGTSRGNGITLDASAAGNNIGQMMGSEASGQVGGLAGTNLRGGGGGVGGGQSIGGPAAADVGGNTQLAKAPEVKVVPKIDLGGADLDVPANAGPVKTAAAKYKGQLKLCYETELKRNPELEGKVVVEWDIVSGAAKSVEVASNTTGSDALASCIVGKVRTWRFEGAEDGHSSMPFVFRPEKE